MTKKLLEMTAEEVIVELFLKQNANGLKYICSDKLLGNDVRFKEICADDTFNFKDVENLSGLELIEQLIIKREKCDFLTYELADIVEIFNERLIGLNTRTKKILLSYRKYYGIYTGIKKISQLNANCKKTIGAIRLSMKRK